jgi:hypothetical protein
MDNFDRKDICKYCDFWIAVKTDKDVNPGECSNPQSNGYGEVTYSHERCNGFKPKESR